MKKLFTLLTLLVFLGGVSLGDNLPQKRGILRI